MGEAHLIETLNDEEHRSEAVELIRGLIEKIVLVPNEQRTGLKIDLYGDLAGILSTATGRSLAPGSGGMVSPKNGSGANGRSGPVLSEQEIQQVKLVAGVRNSRVLPGLPNQQEKMVAGARFELTTFRL